LLIARAIYRWVYREMMTSPGGTKDCRPAGTWRVEDASPSNKLLSLFTIAPTEQTLNFIDRNTFLEHYLNLSSPDQTLMFIYRKPHDKSRGY
jgi:hypothetical protein